MINETLLPCPFCDGKAIAQLKPRGWSVECENRFERERCPVNMRVRYSPTSVEAIEKWNTRAK